jgi:lambda repressor-like predicted transcriptional regulator
MAKERGLPVRFEEWGRAIHADADLALTPVDLVARAAQRASSMYAELETWIDCEDSALNTEIEESHPEMEEIVAAARACA